MFLMLLFYFVNYVLLLLCLYILILMYIHVFITSDSLILNSQNYTELICRIKY